MMMETEHVCLIKGDFLRMPLCSLEFYHVNILLTCKQEVWLVKFQLPFEVCVFSHQFCYPRQGPRVSGLGFRHWLESYSKRNMKSIDVANKRKTNLHGVLV